MKIYYIRCSTEEQNEARQIAAAEALSVDKVFKDKLSGKNTCRPEFQKMMEFVREGDTVICSDISRIARNTRDLLNIVDELSKKHVEFVSEKEAIDTSTPQGRFMLTVFGAMAELEREAIRQRQREGIAIAKQQGKYKGKQPKKIDEAKFREICERWRAGEITAVQAQKEIDLKPNAFYRRVKALGL